MADSPVRTRPPARRAWVSQVEDLAPDYRRLTLEFAAGEPPVLWTRLAVADHVKLALPDPATGEVVFPFDAEEGRSASPLRDYTVRAVPDESHVVVEFALHGSGPGGGWAAVAEVGSEVGVLGPRGSHPMPADRRRYLILVDASALGVAGRWLEEAPQTAVVEVALQGVNRAIALPEHPRGSVTHVAGTDGSGLASFLRDAAPNAGDFVWAAGDARAIVAVRAAARELGLAADDLSLHGYYKPGVPGRDHHAPLDD